MNRVLILGGGVSATTKGYIMGGQNSSATMFAEIESFVFSSMVVATLSAVMSQAVDSTATVMTNSAGYSLGGRRNSVATLFTNAINKLVFSGETCSAISATLNTAMATQTGVENSSYGYMLSGYNSGFSIVNTTSKLTFSNETITATTATITNRNFDRGLKNGNSGYLLGNTDNTSGFNVICKLNMVNDSVTTISETMNDGNSQAGVASASTKGYMVGGFSSAASLNAPFNRAGYFIFGLELFSLLSATLQTSRRGTASMQQG